ncbi:hypothetical protein LTS08_007175 [Lithohypha guttulata]|uniref:Enoyl reductase (ER) domain-containing protein n=1 Tax=Lithohypha guttulata TaxID=1690604 RepID=A0AAN7T1W6_9EURO|nr:hypothetical protein LTR05_003930 [Lithohypha guttulata]KAK5097154.1 hypothetical protein LTS08_007175 [Lithohypha guttulata]
MALSLPETFTSVTLAERPKANIIPGTTFQTKSDNRTPSPSTLKDGEILIKTLYLSLDPAMRGWLNNTRSYIPPVQIGEVMRGSSVGIILASKSANYKTGDLVVSNSAGWVEYAVLQEKNCEKVPDTGDGKKRSAIDALSVVGMTGLTAYFGILRVGEVKEGDFVVVSGAAGATGSVVGQIAKLKGATVLGIAGSPEKCKWLTEELGFDQALNYKDPNYAKQFREATKKRLIDVYFDNVGGEILDLALSRAAPFARFVMCGGISQYNEAVQKGPKNYLMIVSMRIRMIGFIVFDYAKEYSSAREELAQWVREGKLKRGETILEGGLKEAERGLVKLYEGANTGKMLVEVAKLNGTEKSKL